MIISGFTRFLLDTPTAKRDHLVDIAAESSAPHDPPPANPVLVIVDGLEADGISQLVGSLDTRWLPDPFGESADLVGGQQLPPELVAEAIQDR